MHTVIVTVHMRCVLPGMGGASARLENFDT